MILAGVSRKNINHAFLGAALVVMLMATAFLYLTYSSGIARAAAFEGHAASGPAIAHHRALAGYTLSAFTVATGLFAVALLVRRKLKLDDMRDLAPWIPVGFYVFKCLASSGWSLRRIKVQCSQTNFYLARHLSNWSERTRSWIWTHMEPGRKRWMVLLSGWTFIVLGIAGLFLPVLQGILFLMVGLIILSSEYAWARHLVGKVKAQFPKAAAHFDKASERARAWMRRTSTKPGGL